jgi:hypothetical protein
MRSMSRGALAAVVCSSASLLVFAISLFFASPGLAAPQPSVTIRYVAPGGDCSGYTPCYASIQAAVDASGFSNDEIRVAQGTYSGVTSRSGVTQSVYLTKSVTIRGGYATGNWDTPDPSTQPSILDAEGKGRVFFISGNISLTIQGLRMTRGSAYQQGGSENSYDAGGAVYIKNARTTLSENVIMNSSSSPTTTIFHNGGGVYAYQGQTTLSNNTIMSNTADSGSAVAIQRGAATLTGNTIWHNSGDSGSTGAVDIYGATATISGNQIISNTGGFAGGVYIYGFVHATIENNVISENKAGFGGGISVSADDVLIRRNTITNNSASFGGGLEIRHSGVAQVTVEDNTIAGNQASSGGGLHLGEGPIIMRRNVIRFNKASFEGGGLSLFAGGAPWPESNVVADNTAAWHGSGIYVDNASPSLLNTTIARNGGADGSGVQVGSGFSGSSRGYMTNTILVQQAVGITVTTGSTATLNGVLWLDNWANTGGTGKLTVTNAYSGDPLFLDDGYHIGRASAAIDRGVSTSVATDIDGQPRPFGPAPDLGADEFSPFVATHFVYMPVIIR